MHQFFGGILLALVNVKSKNSWPLKAVWWASLELETCYRTFSCPSNHGDLGSLKKQVEQLLCVQLLCDPQTCRICSLDGKGDWRWWGLWQGWAVLLGLSQNSPGSPWGSPGRAADMQILRGICWDKPISASLFLLSPCWRFLAGKNSLTKCLISSNGLITISWDFYDLFGRGTCLASCLLIHCSIIHPLSLDNTFIWDA